MTQTGNPGKSRMAFRSGVTLILVNYLLMAASFVFGALALRGSAFPWWRIAAIALALSWVVFIPGILLAGPGAVGHIGRFMARAIARCKTGIEEPLK